MGDDLGEEWWKHEEDSDAPEVEETTKEAQPTVTTKSKPKKRKSVSEEATAAKKKKAKLQQKDLSNTKKDEDQSRPNKRRKKKKKTISDVLASSEPTPGCPADLQEVVTQYFSDKRSVIEREELQIPKSMFLPSNDLTHSLSSYLKLVCPKWSKLQKQHTEKSSVVLLILCSSALRAIELIKQLTTFKGEAKVMKLFAKHIKIEEQVKQLQKGVTHIGVGTPGRISALLEKESLSMQALRFLVLDWNWRDQKLRRMMDIPEVKLDLLKMLENSVLTACKKDKVKIGLF